MFSDLGFSDHKIYFLFYSSLMIVNEGSQGLKTIVLKIDRF